MKYRITERQKRNARRIGVTIKPSSVGKKKIAVFKNGKKVADVGQMPYKDYDWYLRNRSKRFADSRRESYKKRHQKYRVKKGTASYYADQILW